MVDEELLRAAITRRVLTDGGPGHPAVPPREVAFRIEWCTIHPRCTATIRVGHDRIVQFLHLARMGGLVRDVPLWPRYSTRTRHPESPLSVLTDHIRRHGPVPTRTATVRPGNPARPWVPLAGEITAPDTPVHRVLAEAGPPVGTFREAMKHPPLPRGTVPWKPQTGPLSESDAAEVLALLGHPGAADAEDLAGLSPLFLKVHYSVAICRTVEQAATAAARLDRKTAERLDRLFYRRRECCFETLMLAVATRARSCAESETLWRLLTDLHEQTRSITRSLQTVLSTEQAVALVLQEISSA